MILRDPSLVTEDRPFPGAAAKRVLVAGLAVGVAGLAVGFVLGLLEGDGLRRFLFAYLTAYAYFLSISLGALFFVALQHVTRSSWSVVVRRIAEILAGVLPFLALLSIPVMFGIGRLYGWTGAGPGEARELLHHKSPYLNAPFFISRWVVYCIVWSQLAEYYRKRSLEQDASGDAGLTLRMERSSAPALVLYAFTITFAAFDLLMSLDARWYSTIYGVYYFSGGVVGFFALLTLTAMFLQGTGRLTRSITTEHYHDLGKLLFSFVFFWAYIAFSQYLLIWYANIPEETIWFRTRQSGSWGWMALLLIVGHFALPFLGLLPRAAKRTRATLAFWSAWMLVFHWIDVYWLVMPAADPGGVSFRAVDAACLIGLAGLCLAAAAHVARSGALIPLKDPRLAESLTFENA